MIYTKSAREYLKLSLEEDKYKKEFFKIMREKLESNVNISKSNLYEKIIDENLKGSAAYYNLIQEHCLWFMINRYSIRTFIIHN